MTTTQNPSTMTPAQKAWATRKALAAQRADVATLKAGVATPTPVGDAAMVELYVDDAKTGCGYRRFLVLDLGARKVELFYAPLLCVITVDRLTFDRKAKPVKLLKGELTGVIEAGLDRIERLSPNEASSATKAAAADRALALLGKVRAGKRPS